MESKKSSGDKVLKPFHFVLTEEDTNALSLHETHESEVQVT